MEKSDASSLFESVNRISKAVEKTLNAPGLNIGINNGEVAGQTVPHVHVHIIPRAEDDGGGSMHTIVETHPSTENIAKLADRISKEF